MKFAYRPTVDQQSADFVCDFSCFLGSAGRKNYNWPVFLIGRLSLGLGKWFLVDRLSVDYPPVKGQ